ncbi:hypothetical protein NDU88_003144 [Pleurodeles waltl]|uniref:Uncharacterized protein n=1 Tax=Pleurodeles waltl TaxID=8319 RepID=A0AAV7UFB3_PLEWA|nr:hypothetical protein NDU88_003144 [Pleurodeles waltl]
MAAEKVQEALRLLREAGQLDLLQDGVEGPSCPPRRASGGVSAAVLACSSSREPDERQAVRRRGVGRSKSRAGGALLKGRGRALLLRRAGFRASPRSCGPGSRARGLPKGTQMRPVKVRAWMGGGRARRHHVSPWPGAAFQAC